MTCVEYGIEIGCGGSIMNIDKSAQNGISFQKQINGGDTAAQIKVADCSCFSLSDFHDQVIKVYRYTENDSCHVYTGKIKEVTYYRKPRGDMGYLIKAMGLTGVLNDYIMGDPFTGGRLDIWGQLDFLTEFHNNLDLGCYGECFPLYIDKNDWSNEVGFADVYQNTGNYRPLDFLQKAVEYMNIKTSNFNHYFAIQPDGGICFGVMDESDVLSINIDELEQFEYTEDTRDLFHVGSAPCGTQEVGGEEVSENVTATYTEAPLNVCRVHKQLDGTEYYSCALVTEQIKQKALDSQEPRRSLRFVGVDCCFDICKLMPGQAVRLFGGTECDQKILGDYVTHISKVTFGVGGKFTVETNRFNDELADLFEQIAKKV